MGLNKKNLMWIFVIINICVTIFLNVITSGGAMGMTTLVIILINIPILAIQLLLLLMFKNTKNNVFKTILFVVSIILTIFLLYSLSKVIFRNFIQ